MAQLVLHRSFFDRFESLSVVYLAILYAVLSIVLGIEWGRALSGMGEDANVAAPSTVNDAPSGVTP